MYYINHIIHTCPGLTENCKYDFNKPLKSGWQVLGACIDSAKVPVRLTEDSGWSSALNTQDPIKNAGTCSRRSRSSPSEFLLIHTILQSGANTGLGGIKKDREDFWRMLACFQDDVEGGEVIKYFESQIVDGHGCNLELFQDIAKHWYLESRQKSLGKGWEGLGTQGKNELSDSQQISGI